MTKLSVNINKIATLRNARGGAVPNVVQVALDCERFGADGITVHPRPDERHITRKDVYDLKPLLTTEFNIEGYPSKDFIDLVLDIQPAQVTLVPDPPGALTSNAGWDTVKYFDFLKEISETFSEKNIRVSIFVDPRPEWVRAAAKLGAKRVEFYTEPYATLYPSQPAAAVADYVLAGQAALDCGLEINAGHDLSLVNLEYFCKHVKNVSEVSIGHALISDALYYGLENTIQMYQRCLPKP